MSGDNVYIPGFVRLYAGAMYTGKTDFFLNNLHMIKIRQKLPFAVFKPIIDTRFPPTIVKSRSGRRIDCIPIDPQHPESVLEHITKQTKVVGFDELQFFGKNIVPVVEYLRDQGLYVVGTVLPRDFGDRSFGSASELMVMAGESIPTTGVCMAPGGCDMPGTCTQKLVYGKPANYNDDVIVIDQQKKGRRSSIVYQLRCHPHHEIPGKPPLYKVELLALK